jgi:hypothetical protein
VAPRVRAHAATPLGPGGNFPFDGDLPVWQLNSMSSLRRTLGRHWRWWLLPMLAVLVLFLAAVLLGQGNRAQPFLYSLF